VKRGGPLKRSAGLAQGKPLARKTPLKAGGNLDRGTPIRKQSKKRQRENRERSAMVRQLWPDMEPKCVVLGCPSLADDVHEPLSRGRGGSITDPENAVPICRPHHDEVTFGEPEWAYEQGLLIHSWDSNTVAAAAEIRRRAQSEVTAP
jgi:hypothetical protein